MDGIVIEGVSKRFGTAAVLRDVSATLPQGEFLSLVGPSGCGKTTLLRILAGLETPDAGRVWIGGRDVTALRPADRDVAMVFQNYALYPHLTVAQNLAVPLVMRRYSAIERLPLLRPPGARPWRTAAGDRGGGGGGGGHAADRPPTRPEASAAFGRTAAAGGARPRPGAATRPRFLMGRAAEQPRCPSCVPRTRKEIVDLHRRAGVTTVYVTHDQVEAMTMSDRVALMLDGRILQIGAPRALYDDPAELRVAQFLGSPRINTVAGVVVPGGVAVGALVLPVGVAAADGTPVVLGLRAELLRIAGSGGLQATVEYLEFLGAEVLLHARLAGVKAGADAVVVARVDAAGTDRLALGGPVALDVDWGGVLAFDAAGGRVAVPPPPAAVLAGDALRCEANRPALLLSMGEGLATGPSETHAGAAR